MYRLFFFWKNENRVGFKYIHTSEFHICITTRHFCEFDIIAAVITWTAHAPSAWNDNGRRSASTTCKWKVRPSGSNSQPAADQRVCSRRGLHARAAYANRIACASNCSFCNIFIMGWVASWPVNIQSFSALGLFFFFFFEEMNRTPGLCIIQSLLNKAPVWSNRGSQCRTACPRTTSAGRLCPRSSERKDMNPSGGARP